MSGAKMTEVFECTPRQFFELICDYEKYPEFLTEVKKCQVIEEDGPSKIVEFHISLIKNFTYRLCITEDPPHKMAWTFDSGDLFKSSVGSWVLEEVEGNKTRATYSIDAKFKVFVPGPISKALVNVNLPSMINSYKKRVSDLYGA